MTTERNVLAVVFKVGDRVRIAALGGLIEVHKQGLFVGNTGTVVTLFRGGRIGIRTDGPADDGNALSWDGGGWPFQPGELELIAGDDPTDAAAAERIGVLAVMDAHAAGIAQAMEGRSARWIKTKEIEAGLAEFRAALAPFQTGGAK